MNSWMFVNAWVDLGVTWGLSVDSKGSNDPGGVLNSVWYGSHRTIWSGYKLAKTCFDYKLTF